MKSLMEKLEKSGIESEHLDGMVFELASDIAASTNNDGIESQVEYLTKYGFTTERIWDGLIVDKLTTGMSVEVTDPKHNNSAHQSSFSGTVFRVYDDYVTVRDMEDGHWDVSFDEIESFELS